MLVFKPFFLNLKLKNYNMCTQILSKVKKNLIEVYSDLNLFILIRLEVSFAFQEKQ